MSMAELKQLALRLWKRQESRFVYDYPLLDLPKPENEELLTRGIPKRQLRRVGGFLTAASPQSHIGPYLWAIDFLVPDGTPIYAARRGTVIETVDCHNKWGDGEEFRNKLNFVTIQHDLKYSVEDITVTTTEYSQYCHLAQGSALVKLGDRVFAGMKIATVGKTGWTDRDHLHFVIVRDTRSNPAGFESVVPHFSDELRQPDKT